MKTLFDIGSLLSDNKEGDSLLIEIGDSYCLLSSLSSDHQSLSFLRVTTFDPFEIESSLEALFTEVKNAAVGHRKVIISPAFPQALLVPRKFFDSKSAMLQYVYANNDLHQLHDAVGEWQLMNLYSLPAAVYRQVVTHFPDAVFIHAYTPSLKVYNGFTAENQIAAHFVGDKFRVVVKKEGGLQLVQTYSYVTPMDVIYFLLKICTEFGLKQEETQIILSGFIAEDSALYKELYNYFLNLNFTNTALQGLANADHPKHYFTSISNLAACAL